MKISNEILQDACVRRIVPLPRMIWTRSISLESLFAARWRKGTFSQRAVGWWRGDGGGSAESLAHRREDRCEPHTRAVSTKHHVYPRTNGRRRSNTAVDSVSVFQSTARPPAKATETLLKYYQRLELFLFFPFFYRLLRFIFQSVIESTFTRPDVKVLFTSVVSSCVRSQILLRLFIFPPFWSLVSVSVFLFFSSIQKKLIRHFLNTSWRTRTVQYYYQSLFDFAKLSELFSFPEKNLALSEIFLNLINRTRRFHSKYR